MAQWKKELLTNAGSLFEGKRGPKPVNAHNNPLIWLHQNGMWEYIRNEEEKHETDAEDMDKL